MNLQVSAEGGGAFHCEFADGDAAILTLTQKFDKHPATTIDELFISLEQLKSVLYYTAHKII